MKDLPKLHRGDRLEVIMPSGSVFAEITGVAISTGCTGQVVAVRVLDGHCKMTNARLPLPRLDDIRPGVVLIIDVDAHAQAGACIIFDPDEDDAAVLERWRPRIEGTDWHSKMLVEAITLAFMEYGINVPPALIEAAREIESRPENPRNLRDS